MSEGTFERLVAVQLLPIVQEALTNVWKHAQASHVRIAIACEDDRVSVSVRDDGQGFDPLAHADGRGEHVGLWVMRERAQDVGGSVRLRSAPGCGTDVVAWVPISRQTETGDAHG